MSCKYEEQDFTLLYILVFILLFFGPCGYERDIKEINDKLDRICTPQSSYIIEDRDVGWPAISE